MYKIVAHIIVVIDDQQFDGRRRIGHTFLSEGRCAETLTLECPYPAYSAYFAKSNAHLARGRLYILNLCGLGILSWSVCDFAKNEQSSPAIAIHSRIDAIPYLSGR